MDQGHSAQVLAIYQAGIDGGNATFESAAPDWASFDLGHLTAHRLVAVDANGRVLGWSRLLRCQGGVCTRAWSSTRST